MNLSPNLLPIYTALILFGLSVKRILLLNLNLHIQQNDGCVLQ